MAGNITAYGTVDIFISVHEVLSCVQIIAIIIWKLIGTYFIIYLIFEI